MAATDLEKGDSSTSNKETLDSRWSTTTGPTLAAPSSPGVVPSYHASLWARFNSSRLYLPRLLSLRWSRKESRSREDHRVKIRSVHGGAEGYPLLARFLDSDPSFMTYRRFGHVQARLLVEAQEDLHKLEDQLDRLDRQETRDNKDTLCVKAEFTECRKLLMKTIKESFHEYARLMESAKTLVSLNKPTHDEVISVQNFMQNESPVAEPELSFVYHKEDLVTLRPGREYAWLDHQVERGLKLCDCWLVRRLFTTEETKDKKGVDGKYEQYYDRDRILVAVNTIITMMILVLLIIPIYILSHITTTKGDVLLNARINAICMATLLVATLLFSAGLSFFTAAKRHEILAAAAAYCAVLVVFIGNVGSG